MGIRVRANLVCLCGAFDVQLLHVSWLYGRQDQDAKTGVSYVRICTICYYNVCHYSCEAGGWHIGQLGSFADPSVAHPWDTYPIAGNSSLQTSSISSKGGYFGKSHLSDSYTAYATFR